MFSAFFFNSQGADQNFLNLIEFVPSASIVLSPSQIFVLTRHALKHKAVAFNTNTEKS